MATKRDQEHGLTQDNRLFLQPSPEEGKTRKALSTNSAFLKKAERADMEAKRTVNSRSSSTLGI